MRNAGKLRVRGVLNAVGTHATLCLLVGTLALALSGCGGSIGDEGIPAELVGTYPRPSSRATSRRTPPGAAKPASGSS